MTRTIGGAEPSRRRLLALAVLCLSVLWLSALAIRPAAGQAVLDLHLVLAFDASASVNDQEFALQRAGTAAAFRDPTVLAAITATPGGIAASIVQWSSIGRQTVALGWHVLTDAGSAGAFADAVETMPRRLPGGGTMIHAGLNFAAEMFDSAPGTARRQVIDLSGNGREDDPKALRKVRDRLIEGGVTINALAIEEHGDNLTKHYREHLIGGPHAFVVTARDFEDIRRAMRIKLLREISGPKLARSLPGR